jgi:hypothetical protein
MSISELFGKNASKTIPAKTRKDLEEEFESYKVIKSVDELENTIEPRLNYADPANFVTYGSAYEYYARAIENIYENYPYDGSKYEKTQWHITASGLGNHLFENEYPRTNGHIDMSLGIWGSITTTSGNNVLPNSKEYILVKGGPNTDTNAANLQKLFPEFGGKANVLDASENREANLTLGNGNTVEFWLKKSGFANSGKQEVVFDMWASGSTSGSADYGRFSVYMDDAANPIGITYVSGTAGIEAQNFTHAKADIIDDQWHHYAVSVDATTKASLYVDGVLKDTITGTAVTEQDGTFMATVGSYYAGTDAAGNTMSNEPGWNKLSGSVDDFRFWKTARTGEQVGIHYNTQVFGGTNTDDANTDLGVYFKFNEGVVGNATDATILDYSGRISNGTWVGYSSTARQTGSAMVISGHASSEFKDPIIYPGHSSVKTLIEAKDLLGRVYDQQNNASLYNSIPMWIREDDMRDEIDADTAGAVISNGGSVSSFSSGNVFKMTQIMSSYMDTLQNKVSELTKLKSVQYPSGSEKPFNLSQKNIKNLGLDTADFFLHSSVLERFMDRSEKEDYENKLNDVKGLIYQNIYNNISFIMSSKGTEKSFRNFARCFGIDEKLLKLNVYSDGESYKLDDRYTESVVKEKMISFFDPDRFSSTVYSSSPVAASTTFGQQHGSTIEAEIQFPVSKDNTSPHYFDVPFTRSSLFGLSGSTKGLEVYAVREQRNSANAYFHVSSSLLEVDLTSSVFGDVYDNDKWNFAVKLKPNDVDTSGDYTLYFQGVNANNGKVDDSFILSASVSEALGDSFYSQDKGVFAGAYRVNFTGSTTEKSDILLSNVRYWEKYLSDDDIKAHAIDAGNYGVSNPQERLFNATNDMSTLNTLKLHWGFDVVTGSDGTGQFTSQDLSSGSLSGDYPAVGYGFPSNSSDIVDREFVNTFSRVSPDNSHGAGMVNVLTTAEEISETFSNPVDHVFSIEKSFYQTISDEILKFFSTSKDLASLYANAPDKYREKYDEMELIRAEFFAKMQNEPDVERFYEYFKWIDDSIVSMLRQVLPAGAEITNGPINVIESHILERSKVEHKLPTYAVSSSIIIEDVVETSQNTGAGSGIFGVDDVSKYNDRFWEGRVLAEIPMEIESGNTHVDADRLRILNVVNNKPKTKTVFKAEMTNRELEEKQTSDIIHGSILVNNTELVETKVSATKTKLTLKITGA